LFARKMRVGGACIRSAFDPPAMRGRRISQLGLLILIASFAAVACPGQTQSETAPLLTPQARSPLPGDAGDPSRNVNSNYSDIEQLSWQSTARSQTKQLPLPPEPPTEFQKFAGAITGQDLPIYGASLFSNVPSTFAPLDMTPVPPDYVIGPGDELRIRVWGQVNFQTNVRVDRSGEIFLPQIGPVHVAGLPHSALDEHLRAAVGRVYHNFDLTSDVGQIRAIQVYISGQARRPGVYTVSSLSSLVDALFAGGGPSAQGSMRHIQLRRGSAVVTEFDLYDLLVHGDKSKDVKLQSGDVIFVPPAGPQVAAVGSVKTPAIYELRGDESVAELFADAGGVTSVASEARISIERIDDHRDRHAMEVAYDAAGLATPLADGDLVRVYPIAPIYRKTVIIRGNTANPGRYAWHPGMRVSDLIPDEESLITRNYWWKRSQLGLPGPEQADASSPSGSTQNQSLSAQQRAGSASLASAQASAASNVPSPAIKTEIRKLAPEIDWAFASIERLDPQTLKNTVIPFDLGKLVLQHDTSQDLELQAGDVVSIFSEADFRLPIAQQTKLVQLDGEFVNAGVYAVQPGETFRHLAERAGGLTPNAYLYGSEFTRESARALQQARIDEYVQSLTIQLQKSSLAVAASPSSSASDLASGATAQKSEQDLLASLRQIRATGRIVLEIKPGARGAISLPEIELEDGGRFVVPNVPATVNVVGAVYDQNSFLYVQGRRAGSYLQLAGGPNRDADRSHTFIIRANGEVVSRDKLQGLWGSEFKSIAINPGDTIVVPEKTFKPSALRALIDWSQMFSQFALGAASISLLK